MKNICIFTLAFGILAAGCSAQLEIIEDPERGVLSIREGSSLVLSYRFGDQLPTGIASEQIRSCYIHPLFSLDGTALTVDFPKDHLHHHGVFWTWPVVKTRGQDTQTWHPVSPSLRQHFVRWLKRDIHENLAELSVENVWKLAEQEVVARETVTLRVHPAAGPGRAIDVEIKLQAIGGPLILAGAPERDKGYGGLCLRGADLFTGARLTTDKGKLEKDSTDVPFRWADVSTSDVGVSIFVSPRHPDFPPTWLIRNSYAGILNVSWPGLQSTRIEADQTVTLSYRIYVHSGDVTQGHVLQAYKLYLADIE